MKDIMFDDIKDISKITSIDSYEKHYDEYEIYIDMEGETFRVCDTRNSRCSDLVFTDTCHQSGHASWIHKQLGGDGKLNQHWNHNPRCWEDDEPYGDEISYIGDGLDCCDELMWLL